MKKKIYVPSSYKGEEKKGIITQVLARNDRKFLEDLAEIKRWVAFPTKSYCSFIVPRNEVFEKASYNKIVYHIRETEEGKFYAIID